MKRLTNQIAFVTGATGLIGTQICLRLASEGAVVVAASRQLDKAKVHLEQYQEAKNIIPLELDLSSQSSISAALNNVSKQVGNPSIFVANASLRDGLTTPLSDLNHQSFSNLFEVDVAGHFLCARQLVEELPKEKPGSLIFLSSIYSLAGVDHSIYPSGMSPTPVQYAVVKSAQLGLVRYLAGLWGNLGVRVNGIVAGGIRSPERQSDEFVQRYSSKTMLGRMGTSKEIANVVAFLASDDSSYITGESLAVDGGFLAW